jgi:hypothetical protein
MSKAAETPLTVIGDGARRLEEIRATVAGLPDEFREVFARLLRATADELSPDDPAGAPADSFEPGGSAESHLERIAHYFLSRENKPATLVQIANDTKIPYTTVRTFIYKRHKNKFLKVPMPAGRSVYWSWAELASPDEQGGKNAKGD